MSADLEEQIFRAGEFLDAIRGAFTPELWNEAMDRLEQCGWRGVRVYRACAYQRERLMAQMQFELAWLRSERAAAGR